MNILPGDFIYQLTSNPILSMTLVLTLGVLLVNGWTDAPNSIATCVASRSLPIRKAVLMAAGFDFLGVFVMTLINSRVAQTIYKMVDFRGDLDASLAALCAAMAAIIIWASLAARLGIPTSEGHALIAGISGSAIALQNGWSGINGDEWIKVVYGLFLSILVGFTAGFFLAKSAQNMFRGIDRRGAGPFFIKAQVLASAGMAFMHGAQDGQKLMAVVILGIMLVNRVDPTVDFLIPTWLMLLCAAVMATGTAWGGRRIIKTVGMDMIRLEPYQGFAADAGAAASLLLASMLGLPVSTTHTKTTAIMGVGVARRFSEVKWRVVKDMAFAWLLTFPGCGLVGFLMTFLFIRLFA
ncbi:MAG: inorganic phosphate transporter [Syntrophomonadaceae bacterium]